LHSAPAWPLEFVVDVSWSTHDLLKARILERGVNTVRIQADTDVEALLLAAQVTLCHGVYVTGARIQEVIA
jgi:hypothetical protein